jgi:type III secretion protein L
VVSYYRLNDLGFRLAAGAYVVPRAEFAAVEGANELLGQAKATCEQIVDEAKVAYENERRRGYEDGLAEGRIAWIGQLLNESRELDQGLVAMEHNLTRLVAQCVRKLVMGFDDIARAEAMVRAALHHVRREKNAELRVPPVLYEHFRKRIASIVRDFPGVELVTIIVDDELESDRIVLDTAVGRVDCNIAQRLEEVETVIRSAHARAQADYLDTYKALGEPAAGQQQ